MSSITAKQGDTISVQLNFQASAKFDGSVLESTDFIAEFVQVGKVYARSSTATDHKYCDASAGTKGFIKFERTMNTVGRFVCHILVVDPSVDDLYRKVKSVRINVTEDRNEFTFEDVMTSQELDEARAG